MTTPGSNTFQQAISIQGKQTINYYAASARSVNAIGVFVPAFAAPVMLRGAVQPVQRSLYEQMGLELQQNYSTLYLSRDTRDIARGTSGDRFSFKGRMYQLVSEIDWFGSDKWVGVLCTDLGADPNTYLQVGQYADPGLTDVSEIIFAGKQLTKGNVIVIDVPRWTVGDGFYNPLVLNGLTEDQSVKVNVSIGGVEQGSIDIVADGTGEAIDYPAHYPGLSSYGVVAGGLRAQFNVRLTISSATASGVDITLLRGVDI